MSVVVAVDFSPGTTALTDAVAGIVKTADVVHLVHVEEPNPDFVGFETGPETVKQNLVDCHIEAKKQLQRLSAKLTEQGLQVTCTMLRGQIAQQIIDKAQSEKARLIILGSHGHGALYDLLVGSVAEYVIKSSPIPVVLVPVKA